MAGIGMNLATHPDANAPIEATLVHASAQGMDHDDLRVLSVLTTWLGVHHRLVHADRLIRCVEEHPSQRVRVYWAAIAFWLAADRRLARLASHKQQPDEDLLPVGNPFQISRRGEDERFAGSGLRVPAGVLRHRPADVLTPAQLVCQHAGYRNRAIMGPNWRADVWTVLEDSPDLSVAEAARRAGCSFATAWQVVRDFCLVGRSGGAASLAVG
jgi:hypothetical protein